MADLIKRDHAAQAIEAYLCSQCDHDTDCDHKCIACPHPDGGKIMKSVPAVNRWIPCAERMPDEDEDVLVYVKGDFEHSISFIAAAYNNSEGDWVCGYSGEVIDSKVTHWMPLPEPPEVNSDAD